MYACAYDSIGMTIVSQLTLLAFTGPVNERMPAPTQGQPLSAPALVPAKKGVGITLINPDSSDKP